MRYLNGLALSATLFFPLAASAHPGDHSSVPTLLDALRHLVSQPDHAAILALAVGVAVYLYQRHARANR